MRNGNLILHTEDPLILYNTFASPSYSARTGFTRRRKIYSWFHCSTRFFNLLDFELQAKAGLAFLSNQLSAEARLTIWACPEFGTQNRYREWYGVHRINLAIYPPQLTQCRIWSWPITSAASSLLSQILSDLNKLILKYVSFINKQTNVHIGKNPSHFLSYKDTKGTF